MHRGSTKTSDDSFDAMRKVGVKKTDDLFENIQFREYDREADERYKSTKAFRIPKKTPSATPTSSNQNAATIAVRNILREIEDPVPRGISEEDLAMDEGEPSEEVEVTEIEIVLMD